MRDDEEPIVEDWLSSADAAAYLGLRAPTLYRLINDGVLPAYRLGRAIRIKISDLDAYIASAEIEPGTLAHLYPPGNLDDAG